MSGYNNQSDSFDDGGYGQERQEGGGGAGLRKQLEEVLAKNKELEKRLSERLAKDTEALLKDKGLDPAIKDLIPEGADASEWVDKYAHLLGVQKDTKEQAKADEGSSDGGPEIVAPEDEDPAIALEREALSRINGAADSGSPAHLTGDVLERLERIDSEEELMKFFGSNGAVGG